MKSHGGFVSGLAVTVLLLSGCHSTRVAPISAKGFQPESDEQLLWKSAETVHRYLEQNDLLVEDPTATEMIEKIGDRVRTAAGIPDVEIHIHIVRDPFLNAFALPNGHVYFHTGILARMENGDQLATLLGHEITHFVQRHSLREDRAERNRQTVYRTAAVILALAAAGFSGDPNAAQMMLQLSGQIADVVIAAQTAGYSRDLEREADRLGFRAMANAGFDPKESVELFRLLDEETGDIQEPFYFGSHPHMEERIDSMQSLLLEETTAARPVDEDIDYDGAVSEIRLINSQLDLKIGRTELARHTIERVLASEPQNPKGLFALAELHRRYGIDDDSEELAVDGYLAALSADPDHANSHRELGLLRIDRGQCSDARVHLRRYLDLAPQSPDRSIVEAYIADCNDQETPE